MVKWSEMAGPSAVPAKCSGDSRTGQTPCHMLFSEVGKGSSPLSDPEICQVSLEAASTPREKKHSTIEKLLHTELLSKISPSHPSGYYCKCQEKYSSM